MVTKCITLRRDSRAAPSRCGCLVAQRDGPARPSRCLIEGDEWPAIVVHSRVPSLCTVVNAVFVCNLVRIM